MCTPQTGHTALSLLRNSLGLPGLLAFMPSQVAAAALYWDRTCSGTIPLWPTALANLTGQPPLSPFKRCSRMLMAFADSEFIQQVTRTPAIPPLQQPPL